MSYNSEASLINYVSKYIGYTFYSEISLAFQILCSVFFLSLRFKKHSKLQLLKFKKDFKDKLKFYLYDNIWKTLKTGWANPLKVVQKRLLYCLYINGEDKR